MNAATLSLNWQGPSVGEDPAATYAADIFATVLANPTSRFYKKLVDSGLATGAGFNYFTQAHVGPINVSVQTAPEKVLQAERVLLEEIASFTDSSYVTPEELEAAQKQLGIAALYERERSTAWAHTVGLWWAVAGLDYYRDYVPNMQRVSRGDIAELARKYMAGKPLVVGLLIDPKARASAGITADALLPREVIP